MGLSFISQDHDYCRVPYQFPEYSGRLCISQCYGLKRVETKPVKISQNIPKDGHPNMDLFISRLPHQLPAYMAWKPDPTSKAIDALQQALSHLYPYAFPPFSLIAMVLSKLLMEEVRIIIVTPIWQSQPWYTSLKPDFTSPHPSRSIYC